MICILGDFIKAERTGNWNMHLESFTTPQRKKTNEWFFKTDKGEYSEHDKFMGDLAAAGIGHLIIADFDQVELSNLQRQVIHYTNDIGKDKVYAVQRRLD
jgi:hypothetical protein